MGYSAPLPSRASLRSLHATETTVKSSPSKPSRIEDRVYHYLYVMKVVCFFG